MRCYYDEGYYLPLPEGHPFPMEKFPQACEQVRHAVRLERPTLLGTGLALGFLPFNHGLSALLSRGRAVLGVPEAETPSLEGESVVAVVAVSLLLVGPAEELLYRGVVQALWVEVVGPVAGILAASALFGLVHFPSYGASSLRDVDASVAVGMVGTATAGAYLGASYVLTGTLLVPVVGHALYDAVLLGRVSR